MGAELIMTRLDDLTWNLFAPQVAGARAARERFKRQMRRRFGEEKTSRIAQHAQAAADSEFSPTPSLNVESQAAFWELLVLELRVREIESRIDSAASFYDPYSVWAVLPTLGLSWWNDVLPMVEPPTGQGYMPIRNIKRFLGMVKQANQHLPTRAEMKEKGGMVDQDNDMEHWHGHFRRQRRRLIDFLEKAVRIETPIFCDL